MAGDGRFIGERASPRMESSEEDGTVDVLLTHSYHLAYDRKQWERMQPFPPLATLYAASLLKSRGISVTVFDTMLRDPGTFEAALRAHRPKVVAIFEDSFNFLSKMCLTRMREVAFRMAEAAHRAGALVIAHGSDATDQPDLYLRNNVDVVLFGEGEWALLDTVEASLAGRAVQGRVIAAPHDQRNGLPEADRSLVDIEAYRTAWMRRHGHFTLNLISSRGCPFRCNWCAKPIFGDRYRVRSPQAVAEEMLHLKTAYSPDQLWFADDIFGLDHRWLAQFADEVEARKAALPFKIQARADLLTAENVRNLRRAGCAEVWMGAESGSQKVLDAMEKGLLVEEIRRARRLLGSQGIRAGYFLQFGYPGETWSDIQKTVALVRETRPNDIGVSVSYPLPNTRFYEKVQQQLGAKRNWDDSADLTVMFRGAYSDDFYRSIRNALHAEVESWGSGSGTTGREIRMMWKAIERSEPAARNKDATVLPEAGVEPGPQIHGSGFLPLNTLTVRGGEA